MNLWEPKPKELGRERLIAVESKEEDQENCRPKSEGPKTFLFWDSLPPIDRGREKGR